MEKNTGSVGLFGLDNTNRDSTQLWGKNNFNNNFPVAMACWLRAQNRTCVLISANTSGGTQCSEIPIDELFGVTPADAVHFNFESIYDPYSSYCHDKPDRVDVVCCTLKESPPQPRRALEIKLTVIPDSRSSKCAEELWAPEIVFRPSTMTNCALGLYHCAATQSSTKYIRETLEPICSNIQSWSSVPEMLGVRKSVREKLQSIVANYSNIQIPLLLNPIWKTKGQSPILDNNAFDIFAWTNLSFLQLTISQSQREKRHKISRPMRSCLKIARLLYELSTTGKTRLGSLNTQMSYNSQTDKEYAISGNITINYMKHARLQNPSILKADIQSIITGDSIKNLEPERRLDQTLYFTQNTDP